MHENNQGKNRWEPVAILAVKINAGHLFTEILPRYLNEYLPDYPFRIVAAGGALLAASDRPTDNRVPDLMFPLFGAPFYPENRAEEGLVPKPSTDAMRNPISRFWFLRTAGFLDTEPADIVSQNLSVPRLEVYYPDRSLEAAMRRRVSTSLLLSGGTLVVLLVAYFALYVLLSRTEKLRMRERDFVTSMSHELRTPLSVISATSDNLVEGIVSNPERVKRYGGLIQTQAQRLGKMVESILLYSGIEMMDANRMHSEEVDIEQFFGEIVQSLLPAAEEAEAVIVFSKETQLSSVRSDENALRIIAENLLVNALRHGVEKPSGSVTAPGPAEVRMAIRIRPPRLLYLIVEDDGPGIPQPELKNIFDAFARGEKSKEDQTPGSGLGLHIVKRVCTQLGGHVGVESPYRDMAGESQRGTRFTVRIPIRMEK